MSLYRDVAREVVANAAMGIPRVREWRINRPRAGTALGDDMAALDRYAFFMVRGVEKAVGDVAGLDVVEFGPGDTLSPGFACLAAGASTYAAIDRFVPDYSSSSAKEWYHAIQRSWPNAFPGRPWPTDLDAADFPEGYASRVRHASGGVESGGHDTQYDIVTSWQVGEHVEDVSAFCALTAELMRPNGLAIHRVDFGPHDVWRSYRDPLTFLRFSDPAWRAMGSNRGAPNRIRHNQFLSAWQAAGLKVECRDVVQFDAGAIDFDALHPRFADCPREALLVRGVTYVCRRADDVLAAPPGLDDLRTREQAHGAHGLGQ
jgi:hypothetical protein